MGDNWDQARSCGGSANTQTPSCSTTAAYPKRAEDTIKTKHHNREMEGYPSAISFVNSALRNRCAARNASQTRLGPKIVGSSDRGKGPNDMDVSRVEQEQDQAHKDDDWPGGAGGKQGRGASWRLHRPTSPGCKGLGVAGELLVG